MKKTDIIIICAICAFAAVLAIVLSLFKESGKIVTVKQDSEIIAEYSLDTDREVTLAHNTFVIENGEVSMSCADCKNQICVKTGKISKRGECIVCLPNRVILTIK